VDDVGGDSFFAHFLRQRGDERFLRGLARRVRAHLCRGMNRQREGQGEDAPPAAGDKMRDERLEQVERCPGVLVEHEGQIVRAGFGDGLATRPTADEMDEGVRRAKFNGNSLGGRAKRRRVEQVNDAGVESLGGQVQVADEGVQFFLIVIEQCQRVAAFRKSARGQVAERARRTCDDDHAVIHVSPARARASCLPQSGGRSVLRDAGVR